MKAKVKNQRRLPMDIDFMKCNDKVYSYLQLVSNWTPGEKYRYVIRKNHSYAEMGRELKIDQRTVKTAINKLTKIGAIEIVGDYFRLPEYGKRFRFIPEETLRKMVAGLSVDSIKVYCILSSWNDMPGKITFNKKGICTELGIKKPGGNQYEKIGTILATLQAVKLIDITWEDRVNKYGEEERVYTLEKVSLEYIQSV